MANPVATLVRQYVTALREEPKLRAFAAASFVDDIGVAVATWASTLLMTNLFTSQRARASLVLPTLVAFLLGTIVSGPLADWAGRRSLLRLARWRWRLVVWARLTEAALVGVLLLGLASGAPTIGSVLPFAILAAFSKTAFRPTRGAFAVDLLERETTQVDADGRALLDERGEPLVFKTHLLAMTSLIGALSAAATLLGLILGGRILAVAAGHFWPMFVVQGLMHVGFAAIITWYCHPNRSARDVRLGELVVDRGDEETPENKVVPTRPERLSQGGILRHFFGSIAEGARFLALPKQRPLLILLAGSAIVEFVTESYDGRMIVKHVLHGDDETLRYAELGWSIVGVAGVAAIPILARSVGSIGRIFLLTMLVDGLVMALAGSIAGAGATRAILPFAIVIGADSTLTLASGTLTELAQNSASSAAMRGRIGGTYAFVVIIGDMIVEAVATPVSEKLGIPAMLVRVGVLQVVVVLALAAWGGKRLWRFGLREGVGGAIEPAGIEAT
jgi:MFS family permease